MSGAHFCSTHSAAVIDAVCADTRLTASQIRVLLFVYPRFFAGHTAIARGTRQSGGAVSRAMKALRELGYVEVLREHTPAKPAFYRVVVPRRAKSEAAR